MSQIVKKKFKGASTLMCLFSVCQLSGEMWLQNEVERLEQQVLLPGVNVIIIFFFVADVAK
jgi:hypothetical protein